MLTAIPVKTWPGGSLSNEQKRAYEKDGYLILPKLLSDEELEPAREALSQKVDEIADRLLADGLITDTLRHRPFAYRLAELFAPLTNQDFNKYAGRSWRDRFPGYFKLMSNPKIIDAVESLIGPEIFSNPVYNSRPKVPKVAAGAVPWHQDKSYWPEANSNPVITVWIPIVDSTPENGCLHLIPGTHTRRVYDSYAEGHTGTGYLEITEKMVQAEAKKRQIVALPVPAGSAILFNDRLLHMSTPNLSDHVRWSVDLRYQSTDQDLMEKYGAGFLVRSQKEPERVATLTDWLEMRLYHGGEPWQPVQ
jgi:phytanoyl-CoA hydroxylase